MALFHRIVSARRAATAMDGEGARRLGGRWNPPGFPVAYMTESRALAALEIMVHAGRDAMDLDWMTVSAEVSDDFIEKVPVGKLPEGWNELPSSLVSRRFGESWIKRGRKLGLLLPSVVIPEERVLMLNVLHPDFSKLKISEPAPFRFDHRLG